MVSYDKKWTGVHGFTCLLSHKSMVDIKHLTNDINIVETFIQCLISINMGITSYHKDDATHLTYTPLERENSMQSRFKINRV